MQARENDEIDQAIDEILATSAAVERDVHRQFERAMAAGDAAGRLAALERYEKLVQLLRDTLASVSF